ncbi:PREDICTED: ATP-binding cassette sub-family D member 2 isoform X1 [Papilio xuthus]|uniref:ATP-binding cassette sub-family D member 2 isoform X1 n=3 Tax=Papilio xuthus TaxID=66420 RepID=A0AAJ6ZB03_PAPXU|nr:PREDICTED: ATP-binding cassette sub-family D member 2 isoform X1 [Papilio xuthus]XP_013168807.1 PREDICTED: ATP-binding cassette sub-family D member 2 isoform X1 [Papilio xuthus]
MPAILTKIREQAFRVQPSIAVGVGVGVALAACAVYAREKKQPPPCHNNNNYKVAKNGTLHAVQNGGAEGQTCGRCGEEQCALCRGDADTDNKQNIAEADEAPTPEEHVPGLNLEFLRQLLSLVRIMVPGLRSQEVALLAAHTLCLFSRTFLSIYVASLEGSIVKHIVQKDLRHFTSLLVQWFGIAVPATFVNSMIRYLEGRLALAFRTRLVNHAYELYFKNQTYYRVANLDARIENADHRLTEDVSVFTQSVAHLYSSLTKPCFDLLLIVLTLATYSNKMKGNIFIGPGMATVVICLTGQLLRLLSPRFGALAGEEARMRANLRHAHSRLITHAEEVAFYGGHKVELGQLQSAYKQLVVQMTTVFNKKLWYVMLEQFCMKYVWSGTGMVMLALPILTGRRSDESNDEGISARTEYMTTSRNLLNSAADAIERLMSSYKEVVTLAGYATRVSDMLVVFGEVARGRCVRAVHATPTHPGFQVTFRERQPVPLGKITYTNDLSIRLNNVPIVTPTCDVVASGVTLQLAPGTHLLIVGPNGCGKSSLFRIISGLWPVFGGELAVPRPCACAHCAGEPAAPPHCASRPVMFYIPQRPYMSVGSLLDQVTYPSRADAADTEAESRAAHILRVVRLDACAARLGGLRATADWRATLSGGEKQRLAMARMFYHRPVYALLDECTSAVSLETELVMYEEAVRCGITLLSITHRPSVWKYHTHVLEFDGAGNWSFRTLDKDAPIPTPGPPSISSEPTSSPPDSGGEQ